MSKPSEAGFQVKPRSRETKTPASVGGVGSVIGYIGGRIAQFIHAGVDERRRLPGQCVIVRYPNAARPTRQECAIARIVRRCGYGVQGKASDSLVARDPCGAPSSEAQHSVVICRSV
jgi:hypothetical protein